MTSPTSRPVPFTRTQASDLKPGQWVETPDPATPAWVWRQVTHVAVDVTSQTVNVTYEPDTTPIPVDGHALLLTSPTDPTGLVHPRCTRPDWDEFFLGMAAAASVRADCRRRQVGAVLVQDRHVIATGYNGAVSGQPGCMEGACPRGLLGYDQIPARSPYDDPTSDGYCSSVHAETNAIYQTKVSTAGATCYTTDAPCPGCTKALAAAGVVRVVWPSGDGWEEGHPVDLLNQRTVIADNPR